MDFKGRTGDPLYDTIDGFLWNKFRHTKWSPADRETILRRVYKDNPALNDVEACIARHILEFLRARDKRKVLIRPMNAEAPLGLSEFIEKYSERSENPDIVFTHDGKDHEMVLSPDGTAGQIWHTIMKVIPDRPLNERMDVFSSVLEALIKVIRAGTIRANDREELGAWLKEVTRAHKNRSLRGVQKELAHRVFDPTRPRNIDNTATTARGMKTLHDHRIPYSDDEVFDDDWLENMDVTNQPTASKRGQYPGDSWAYGQYPEADMDVGQYDEQVRKTMGGVEKEVPAGRMMIDDKKKIRYVKKTVGGLSSFFFGKESGRSIRDQVERRNTATKNIAKTRAERVARVAIEAESEQAVLMKKYLDATANFPKLQEVSRSTVTRAVDDARKVLGGRPSKKIYRGRKKNRAK